MTLEEFGRPLDCHKSTLSLYLSGKRRITDKFLRALERVYGVSYAWMDRGEGSAHGVDKSTVQTTSGGMELEEAEVPYHKKGKDGNGRKELDDLTWYLQNEKEDQIIDRLHATLKDSKTPWGKRFHRARRLMEELARRHEGDA